MEKPKIDLTIHCYAMRLLRIIWYGVCVVFAHILHILYESYYFSWNVCDDWTRSLPYAMASFKFRISLSMRELTKSTSIVCARAQAHITCLTLSDNLTRCDSIRPRINSVSTKQCHTLIRFNIPYFLERKLFLIAQNFILWIDGLRTEWAGEWRNRWGIKNLRQMLRIATQRFAYINKYTQSDDETSRAHEAYIFVQIDWSMVCRGRFTVTWAITLNTNTNVSETKRRKDWIH